MKYRNFHDAGKGPFFEGWYLKHQQGEKTLALIPSFHREKNGHAFASLQIITGEGSWSTVLPPESFWASRDEFQVRAGGISCSSQGLHADLSLPGLRIQGEVRYGPFAPPRKDMMGPFRVLSFLPCHHGVLSLFHSLSGQLSVNGELWDFAGGQGYLEKDWGSSFPESYLWTHCFWEQQGKHFSLMAAAASVPLGPAVIRGCICALLLGDKQVRMATYLGARVLQWGKDGVLISQGPLLLEIRPLSQKGHLLQAPQEGAMSRGVREAAALPVRLRLWLDSRAVLDRVCTGSWEASFPEKEEQE